MISNILKLYEKTMKKEANGPHCSPVQINKHICAIL